MERKYPFIPRDLYPAVMFACSLVREHGSAKAARIAAGHYRVSEADVLSHLRARQAAGQKNRKPCSYQHYRFKGVADIHYDDRYMGFKTFDRVFKAANPRNARKQLDRYVNGGLYDTFYFHADYRFEIECEPVRSGSPASANE